MILDCAFARLGALPGAATALALPGPRSHMTGRPGKGDVVHARGLVDRVPGLASRALTPQLVRSHVDACALVGDHHALPLPMCGLGGPGRGLRTIPRAVGFDCTLGVTARGLARSTRALLAAAGPTVTVRDHTDPGTGHGTGLSSPLSGFSHGRGVGGLGGVTGIVRRLMVPPRIAVTLGHGWGLPLW